MQAGEANLQAVRRPHLALLLLLTSLGAAGCAGGELAPKGRVAEASTVGTVATLATHAAPSPVARAAKWARSLRETSSPRTEGAAFLALPLSAPAHRAHEVEPEERIAAILNTSTRCPEEMALVDGRVCVDRWEASLVERVSSGASAAERPWSPYVPVDGHERDVRAVSRPGVIPQAYISGKQAAAACGASGKRLCAGEEWERACRGPQNQQFPYGAERRAGVCNDDVRPIHPMAEVAHLFRIAGKRTWKEAMNLALINQLADTVVPTGERAECTNAYGVYDMVGNVHEWVDDPKGTFRGGYYMDTTKNGDGCSYRTTRHDFTYHDYSTGFRCCMDPESVE